LHGFAWYLHGICMGLHAYASPMQVRNTTAGAFGRLGLLRELPEALFSSISSAS